MAGAVFTSSVTYVPGGGGSLTQGFRVAFSYSAVSAGTIDIAAAANTAVVIPFGGVGSSLGLVVQNNTNADVTVSLNAASNIYRLSPGGVVMHWAPAAPGGTPLTGVSVTPQAPTEAGSVDYVVLGN